MLVYGAKHQQCIWQKTGMAGYLFTLSIMWFVKHVR